MSGMNKAAFAAKIGLKTETVTVPDFGDVTLRQWTVGQGKAVGKRIREDETNGAALIAIASVIDSETGELMFELNDESLAFFQSLPIHVVKFIAEAANTLNGFTAPAKNP